MFISRGYGFSAESANLVEICGMAQGKRIRIEAEAVRDTRHEACQAMLDEYGAALTQMYSLDNGIYVVLLFIVKTKSYFVFFFNP